MKDQWFKKFEAGPFGFHEFRAEKDAAPRERKF
jgi:hypothetical protein